MSSEAGVTGCEEFEDDHLKEIGFPRPEDEVVNDALEVLRRVQRILLRQPGARAVDVGFRIIQEKNRFEPEVAIRVHVENKLNKDKIKESGQKLIADLYFQRLAGVFHTKTAPPDEKPYVTLFKNRSDKEEFENQKDKEKNEIGYRIDVIEARYLPSTGVTQVSEPRLNNQGFEPKDQQALALSHIQPLVGGVSIGNERGQAGTLAAVVWDRTDGTPCLLSNWHILAGRRAGNIRNRCFQPALLDGGTPDRDFVGHFKRGLFDRHGDAALASIADNRPYNTSEILGLWMPVAGSVEPKLGMPVRKFGRTTGFSLGFIDGVGFTVNLEYSGLGTRFFEKQVHIATRIKGTELSAPGDSGALWVAKYEPRDPDQEDETADVVELQQEDRVPTTQSEALGYLEKGGQVQGPTSRIYFAAALNFAGDAPGAPTGEFAIATPIPILASRLNFSFRPLFFPRSGYVVRTGATSSSASSTGLPDGQVIEPRGGQGDPASGPQPDPEESQTGGGG
ncbi:MAG: hypothetical protein GY719_03305 [bacterium]|nr:hypothetical protein [bacterium]